MSSQTTPPQTYRHPTSGSTVLPILHVYSPYSLPLLRRLQFSLRTPDSHVLASFPPSENEIVHDAPSQCVCVAFVDRSRRPETECWLFLSSEVPYHDSITDNATNCPKCTAALLAMVKRIATLPLPAPSDEEAAATGSGYTSHLADPSILLIGTVHSTAAEILKAANLIRTDLVGLDVPYQKFIFNITKLPPARTLPPNLRFDTVRPQDFALVRNRTQIPRRDRTLAILPSMALYDDAREDDAPIAWAFLGPDASLSSLHVEPEYRGKGLAKAVTNKLFTEKIGGAFGTEEWAHSDVALDNQESKGVALSLGGQTAFEVYWVRVDLKKA